MRRMTPAEKARIALRVERAKSAIPLVEGYRLGQGGFDPKAPSPGRFCDCSGFVAWVLGLSRRPKPSRMWWIETTNVWRDASGRMSVFVPCDPTPGCVIVYPDNRKRIGLLTRTSQGHMAIVSAVDSRGRPSRIVDCSASKNGVRERREAGVFTSRDDWLCCTLRQDLAGSEQDE